MPDDSQRERQAMSVGGDVAAGMKDVAWAFKTVEAWGYLGFFDIRQRYRRSVIGPFWIVISTAALVGGISFMMSTIQQRPLTGVVGYILIGMILFQFLSSAITESCSVFINNASYIKSFPQPVVAHLLRALWIQVIIFAHMLVLYPVVILITGIPVNFNILFAIPGILIVLINVAWVALVLATLSARFRDIPMIVGNILSFMVFLTPVFWQVDDNTHKFKFVDYNPLYWFIQIVREPMLGNSPPADMWISSFYLACFGWIVALFIYSRCFKRLTLWI